VIAQHHLVPQGSRLLLGRHFWGAKVAAKGYAQDIETFVAVANCVVPPVPGRARGPIPPEYLRETYSRLLKAVPSTRFPPSSIARWRRLRRATRVPIIKTSRGERWLIGKTCRNEDDRLQEIYDFAASVREILHGLTSDQGKAFQFGQKFATVVRFEDQRVFSIADNGVVKVEGSALSDGLIPALEAIEASRIRLCPECGQLFFAWRRDKSGCSDECRSVLNQRRHRERERGGKYKMTRGRRRKSR
jgi:hypothetical protein